MNDCDWLRLVNKPSQVSRPASFWGARLMVMITVMVTVMVIVMVMVLVMRLWNER